jgi:hypothetical protein
VFLPEKLGTQDMQHIVRQKSLRMDRNIRVGEINRQQRVFGLYCGM